MSECKPKWWQESWQANHYLDKQKPLVFHTEKYCSKSSTSALHSGIQNINGNWFHEKDNTKIQHDEARG